MDVGKARNAQSVLARKIGSRILGGGFKYFLCSPLPGELIQFD